MQYVYILNYNDGHHYTGCTENLRERLQRHQNGNINFTRERLPALPTIENFQFDSKAGLFIPAEQGVIFLMAV